MYRLRELEKKDLEAIIKWCNDLELISLLGIPFRYIHFDIDSHWLENYTGNMGSAIRCAIVSENDDNILGVASITSVDYKDQSAELHIKMGDKESQEMEKYIVKAMLSHAFWGLNLRRIEVMVLGNKNEKRSICREFNFKYEGKKRKAYYKNGAFFDVLCYALLREEYEEKYPEKMAKLDIPNYCIALSETKDEIKEIIEMCDDAFSIPVCSRENGEAIIKKLSTAAIFIYAYSNEVMGYAAMYCNDVKDLIAYISLIGVKSEYQNQHIGTALMNVCIHIAELKGMAVIRLEVRKNNVKAVRFYTKHDFSLFLDKDEKSWIFQKILTKGTN